LTTKVVVAPAVVLSLLPLRNIVYPCTILYLIVCHCFYAKQYNIHEGFVDNICCCSCIVVVVVVTWRDVKLSCARAQGLVVSISCRCHCCNCCPCGGYKSPLPLHIS
jgi:hypothetical protein